MTMRFNARSKVRTKSIIYKLLTLIIARLLHLIRLGLCVIVGVILLRSYTTDAQNRAVKVNDTVQLVCNKTYTLGKFWSVDLRQESSTMSERIHFEGTSTVLINQSDDHRWSNPAISHAILSIQDNQAGMYVCVDQKPSAALIANVIVLDSDPTCSEKVSSIIRDPTVIEMSCTIKFTGYWFPVMHWKRENETIRTINGSLNTDATNNDNSDHNLFHIAESRTRQNNSVTIMSVLTLRRNGSVHSNQVTSRTEQYQCVTYFTVDKKPTIRPLDYEIYKSVRSFDNIPDYRHSCALTVVLPKLTSSDKEYSDTIGNYTSDVSNSPTTSTHLPEVNSGAVLLVSIFSAVGGLFFVIVVTLGVCVLIMFLRQKRTLNELNDVRNQNAVTSTTLRSAIPLNIQSEISQSPSHPSAQLTDLRNKKHEMSETNISARASQSYMPLLFNVDPHYDYPELTENTYEEIPADSHSRISRYASIGEESTKFLDERRKNVQFLHQQNLQMPLHEQKPFKSNNVSVVQNKPDLRRHDEPLSELNMRASLSSDGYESPTFAEGSVEQNVNKTDIIMTNEREYIEVLPDSI